ncbi:MAG TPA: hypothetical protein VF186_10895 [Gaiellaceae bacterium]
MWVVRQLARLLERVVVLVAIAGIVAGIAAARSGQGMHVFRLTLIVVGCIIAALGAMGSGTAYQRDADLRTARWTRYWSTSLIAARPDEPQLASGATLAVAGGIAILLGFFV